MMAQPVLPKRFASAILLAPLLLVTCALPLWAQDAPGTAEVDRPEPDSGLISLHADSTAVVEILKILADRSGLNIVTGPAVRGRSISLRLRDTPFEEALSVVCRVSGLGYERIGNTILVADPSKLSAKTGLASRVFCLKNAEAKEVTEALEGITTGIKAYGNCLVVWAPHAVIGEIERAIDELDQKPTQVLLEARLIEVNTSRLLELGVDWEKLTKWTGVITEGDPGTTSPGVLPDEIDYIQFGSGEKMFRQMESLELAVDALITKGAGRLLSNTKVVTLNGAPAEIFAGETVPVVVTSLQAPGGAGGVLQTVQLQKIDVGVRLNITPRIGANNYITTIVEPEISRIMGFVGPDDDLPQTSTRRAKTVVRVKSGRTIYLGGLITEEKRQTIKKLPILGDIPLLGYFFQHRRDDVNRLDILIEITPTIVGDEGTVMPVIETPQRLIGSPEEQPERWILEPPKNPLEGLQGN